MNRFSTRSLAFRWSTAVLIILSISPATQAEINLERAAGRDFNHNKARTLIFPGWFKQSFWYLNDDINDAIKAGKIGIMIDASEESCTYCIAFIERSLNNPEIQKRFRKNFDALGLEVIGDTEIHDVDGKAYSVKNFLKKYKAYVTPTLLFFGKDGKLLLKITGYYSPEKFTQVLDYFESGQYQKQSWRDYYTARNDKGGAGIVYDTGLFRTNVDNLARNKSSAKRPLMVLFEKPGCEDCRRLHEKVLSAKTTRNWIKQFDAVQINADDDKAALVTPGGKKTTARAWASALNLAYYPAFVFFDESGNEVFRIDSYTRNVRLEGSMSLVLNKGYLDEPQLQRWNRARFVRRMEEQQK
ncbi:MAG: thioredoxin family protein [Acidiferrobacterales bacterium]